MLYYNSLVCKYYSSFLLHYIFLLQVTLPLPITLDSLAD